MGGAMGSASRPGAGDRNLVGMFALLLAAGYLWERLAALPETARIFYQALGPAGIALLILPAAAGVYLWRRLRAAKWPAFWSAMAPALLALVVTPTALRAMLVAAVDLPPLPSLSESLALLAGVILVLALSRLARYRPGVALTVLAVCCALLAASLGWWRYVRGTGSDTGLFCQALWNTLHGRLMNTTFEGGGADGLSHLAVHFSPTLFLLTPLYALWPDGRVLMITQAVALGAAAWPCFKLLAEDFPGRPAALSRSSAFMVTGALLLSAGLFCPAGEEFHEMTLAPVAFLWAAYYWERGRMGRFAVWAVLLLGVKETFAPIVALFAVLALARRQGWRRAILPLALGAVSLAASWWVIAGSGQPAFYDNLYAHLGPTPGAKVHTLVTEPGYVLHHLVRLPNRVYLAQVLGPLGYLAPLTSVWAAFAVPHLVANMLSLSEINYPLQLFFWHSTLAVTALVLAFGLALGKWRRRLGAGATGEQCVAALALVSVAWACVPWLSYVLKSTPSADYARQGRSIARLVPPEAPLLAPYGLSGWVANRRQLYFHRDSLVLRPDYVWRDSPALPIPPGYRLVARRGPHELWERMQAPRRP